MAATKEREKYRVQVTLDADEYERLKHWSSAKEMTINDYIREAIIFLNKWELGEIDLPTLEIQRLNQLVDGMQVLSSNVHSLEKVITSGFDSLLGLTKGENYLLEHNDV